MHCFAATWRACLTSCTCNNIAFCRRWYWGVLYHMHYVQGDPFLKSQRSKASLAISAPYLPFSPPRPLMILEHFCRATLCIARPLLWCSVYLFVYLSGLCKNILELFHLLVAPPFQFFLTKHYIEIPTGSALTEASNAGGVRKNRDFQPISRFIWETIQEDKGTVSYNDILTGSYTRRIQRCNFEWTRLTVSTGTGNMLGHTDGPVWRHVHVITLHFVVDDIGDDDILLTALWRTIICISHIE